MGDFSFTDLENKTTPNQVKGSSLGDLVTRLLDYVFPIVGILLLLYLLSGGIQLMTSRGDPKAIEAAKQKITNAVIGVVIVFASYWLVQVVISFLGIGDKAGGLFGL